MAERTPARKAADTPAIRCESRVQAAGATAILRLPDDASARLPSRGQVAVEAVLNGHRFQAALADAPDIRGLWESITPMARWEWVRWINATRNPRTRERRVEVSISKIRSGKRRPCCFDLSACTDPDLSKNGKLEEVR